MKAPATHPLLDMPVTLPDGRRGRVLKVFDACSTAPERCMVEVEADAPINRFTIIPSADLRPDRCER